MNALSSVDTSMASEIASVLKFESDKAYKVYKEAIASGAAGEEAQEAWKIYCKVDDSRRLFQRSMESVKEVLDTSR